MTTKREMHFLTDGPRIEHRAGRMMAVALASPDERRGGVVVTVELTRGDTGAAVHQTLRLKPWVAENGATMVSVTVPRSGDWRDGVRDVRVAVANTASGVVFPSKDSRSGALLWFAALAALRFVWTGETPAPSNGSVRVLEESRCAVCGTALRHPESIDLGVGPECANRPTVQRTFASLAR